MGLPSIQGMKLTTLGTTFLAMLTTGLAPVDYGAKAVEASRAARELVRSGRAQGTFTQEVSDAASPEFARRVLAQCAFTFRGQSYLLDLKYQVNPVAITRTKVLYDGSCLVVVHYGDAFGATGCEAVVYDADPAAPSPPVTGFAFNPARWNWGLLPLPKADYQAAKYDSLPDGRVRATVRSALGEVEFFLEPGQGFNTSSVRILGLVDGKDEKVPFQETNARWQRIQELWCIMHQSQTVKEFDSPRALVRSYRSTVALESFMPNLELPDGAFSMDRLELPPGTRILDQRKNVDTRERHLGGARPSSTVANTTIASQVESVPPYLPSSLKSDPERNWRVLLWIVGGALLMVGGTLALLQIRRRRSG